MKWTTIKRRLGGKGFQVLKRVVLPGCILLFLFNFLTGPPTTVNFPREEQNMIVPGEALDPLIIKAKKPHADRRHDNKNEKFSESHHSKIVDQQEVKESQLFKGQSSEPSERGEPLKKPVVLHEERKTTDSKNKFAGSKPSFDDSDIPPRMETSWSMAKANIPDMDKVKFKGHAITNDTVTLTLMSSSDKVFMSINKKEIYRGIEQRGLHVVVLNQYNGRVMAKRVFDTFQKGVENDFVEFIDDISAGRLIVLSVEDEITTGLTWKGRGKLKDLGSRFAKRIAYRDMWAMVTRKDGLKIAETFSNVATADTGYEWGGPIFMRTDFDLEERPVECQWPFNERNQARRLFCVRYEGYGKLCSCDVLQWEDVFFEVDQTLHQKLALNPLHKDLGVIISATNRPHSLYRTLKGLHEAPGFNKDLVAIYVESPTREVINLAKLFGVTVVETKKFKNISIPARIRHKMQRVLSDIIGAKFDPKVIPEGALPDSEIPPFRVNNIFVLEEDISVSIDLFKYLYTVYPVLKKDSSVLGISAFNYHGFREVVDSQTNSYRTTTYQSIAILLPAKSVNEILVPHWPSIQDAESDWFVGLEAAMEGEKSIIYPEITRTRHSSYEGFVVSGAVQAELFKDHMMSLTTKYDISQQDIDRLILPNYEKAVRKTLTESQTLEFDFCKHDLLYGHEPFVMFLDYNSTHYANWSYLMKCLNAWSVYPLGGWRDVWQFRFHGHLLSIVGVPTSPFSSYKPEKYQLITAPPNNTTSSSSPTTKKV